MYIMCVHANIVYVYRPSYLRICIIYVHLHRSAASTVHMYIGCELCIMHFDIWSLLEFPSLAIVISRSPLFLLGQSLWEYPSLTIGQLCFLTIYHEAQACSDPNTHFISRLVLRQYSDCSLSGKGTNQMLLSTICIYSVCEKGYYSKRLSPPLTPNWAIAS